MWEDVEGIGIWRNAQKGAWGRRGLFSARALGSVMPLWNTPPMPHAVTQTPLLTHLSLFRRYTLSDHYTLSHDDCRVLGTLTSLNSLYLRAWLPRPFSEEIKVRVCGRGGSLSW